MHRKKRTTLQRVISYTRILVSTVFTVISLFFTQQANAQLRQAHLESDVNDINKVSFYSGNEGYVAFNKFIGFTTDSGKTYTQKPITASNVNFNGYAANLTFGFEIRGVKAFNQNIVIAYGDYGLVPAILYSSDQGNTYKLIFHSSFSSTPNSGIMDMAFPQNGSTGYAIDADRVLKTTDGGLTWAVTSAPSGVNYSSLQAVDNNTILAFSNYNADGKLYKSTNGGSSWQQVTLPLGHAGAVNFLTVDKGWYSAADKVYSTTNGGTSWVQQNNTSIAPFNCDKMLFVNDSTGYALVSYYEVYKTSNSGAIWEKLFRNNHYTYLGYSLYDIQLLNTTMWVGGGHGFLELSNNSGGTPIPKALFTVDTTGLSLTGKVKLQNYSKSGYHYQWLVNNTPVNSTYNTTYTHDVNSLSDAIRLIVSNSLYADTLTKNAAFNPPVVVNSFSPATASAGTQVTITGLNFSNATAVSFGGVRAASYTVVSPTSITAVVGVGASGKVAVSTPLGGGTKDGFTFVPAPTVGLFSPSTASAGATVTITGTNFTGVTAVLFGNTPATSFTVLSATTITAVLGNGASGNISVTTPGGTATITGFLVTPVITSFTPTSGTIGTVVTITGTGLGDATAITVSDVAVQSFTINSNTSISAVISRVLFGSGKVKVTSPGGSSELGQFTYYDAPKISSFAPLYGVAGSTVTISGSNFSTTLTDNVVYFGAVKAVVTAATTNTLTVKVPLEATYNTISVTTHHLSTYSQVPFTVAFAGKNYFSPKSFSTANAQVLPLGSTPKMVKADFDNDGKIDFIAIDTVAGPAVIFKNNSTAGHISFSPVNPNISLVGSAGTFAEDIDGDGLKDIIVIGDYSSGLNSSKTFLYRNTSSSGTISFAPGILLSGNLVSPTSGAVADLDGDGKPDVIAFDFNTRKTMFYQNKSEPGTISFYPAIDITGKIPNDTYNLVDFDGDGLIDIVSAGIGNVKNVLRNNSSPGNISFTSILLDSSTDPFTSTIGDVDGDGKTDIVMIMGTTSVASVYKNNSSPGSISFSKTTIPINSQENNLIISDIDGDGKADIVGTSSNYNNNQLQIHKNISANGTIAFANAIIYTVQQTNAAYAVDIDGDGKNDLLANSGSKIIALLNNVGPAPYISSFTPTIAKAGTTVTITGANFTGATAVSFGGVAARSFQIVSDQTITAVAGTGASGDVNVTNSFDTGSLSGFAYGIPPVITSFSPYSGKAGTQVTINGSNFGEATTDNTVYFGKMKATVVSATATKLVVSAPAQATYQPISVTSSNLTAFTDRPFNITFDGGDTSFTVRSFSKKVILDAQTTAIGDVDGDGKLDLVGVTGHGATIAINRNTSTGDSLSFSATTIAPLKNESAYYLSDLDGDGKLDLITVNNDPASTGAPSSISCYKNTSSPGNVSFAAKVKFEAPESYQIQVTDVDGDGRPDIAITDYSNGLVAFLHNISTNGNILFAPRVDFHIQGYVDDIAITDMDGDGKPDLLVAGNSSAYLHILKNTSTAGAISFGNETEFADDNWPLALNIADLDSDGRLDAVTANSNTGNGNITFFRNTSSGAAISFIKTNKGKSLQPGPTAVADLNGDGKPDYVLYNELYSQPGLYIYKNSSTAGNILFKDKDDYFIPGNFGTTITYAIIGDFDGDGKPDIAQSIDFQTTIFRNKTNTTSTVITGFTPKTAATDAQVTINGLNFTGASAVSFGGVPAKSFTVTSATSITATVGAGKSGTISVTNAGVAATSDDTFTYLPPPTITSFTPKSAGNGTTVTITGTNFANVTAVAIAGTYENFTIVSPTTITAVIGDGTTNGNIVVYSPGGSGTISGFVYLLPPSITSYSPTYGTEGTVITITGINLSGATAVSINDVPAKSFTVVSPTTITAVVGKGIVTGAGGSGFVIVTTPAGKIFGVNFTYYSGTTLTSFSPAFSGSQGVVTITGYDLNGATSVTFGGVPAQSFTVNSPTSITAVLGAGASGDIRVVTPENAASLSTFTYVNKPVITTSGPTTITTGAYVTLQAPYSLAYAYQWTKDGVPISGALNYNYDAKESGSYAVNIKVTGGYTTSANPVSVTVLFTLPATNFKIAANSVTCKGQANGEIDITANQALSYTALVTGNGISKTYAFTNTLKMPSLAAGAYNICFTVANQPTYKQCFDVNITEPKDLSVYATVNKTTNTVSLNLSGSDVYNVQLNGINYQASGNSINLPLSKGSNTLVVSTDKLCQGSIEQIINTTDNTIPYPNPFQSVLYVNIGEVVVTDCAIKIYSATSGQLKLSQHLSNQSGVIRLDVSGLGTDIYSFHVVLDGKESVYKISKQ